MRIGIDGRKLADYGIGTYIQGLLRGLLQSAPTEEIVVFAPERHASLIPEAFKHVAVDAPHYSLREMFVMGRAAARARLDLFHAPHYVVPLTRCPTVVTVHDLIHLHQMTGLKALYARTMIRRAVNKSARVITVTETVKGQIMETFHCPEGKVVVTPNGVDDRFRVSVPNKKPSRYFLFVGNDKPHKNLDRLVEAFAQVHRDAPDVTLVLVGAPFERFRGRPGLVCPGFVAEGELTWFYRHALALAQPSLEEGFGLPVAEAMASGTAVITSTAPALVEVTGEAALHVDAQSVEAIAAAMRDLALDEELRVRLAHRGIARAREWTWRRCAELTLQTYRSVILNA